MRSALRERAFGGEVSPSAVRWLGIGAAVAVVLPFLLPAFQRKILTTAIIFAILATAFNLLYGYTGLLSFGHAMFVAIAGYTVAKVVQVVAPALGVSELAGGLAPVAVWLLALVLGTVLAALLAVFIGFLSVRLEEIYFALITLSFSMAIWVIANQDIPGSLLEALGYGNGVFTNGSDGLTFTLGSVNLFGWEWALVDIVNPLAYYFVVLIVFAVITYGLWRIVVSPFGTTCKAIRENPERARALGIDVTRHQWITFIISGTLTGTAGAVLIPLLANANPDQAYWTFSALPVLMTVIGGAYAFFGPLAGAFAYEYLRWFISQFQILEAYWQFSFGVLLLVVVLFFPNGIYGGLERFAAWRRGLAQRYREDGVSGALEYLRATSGDIRESVRRGGRSVWRSVRRLAHRVRGR